MNIVEIASGSDDFNLLVRALTAADLVTTVQDATDITVFAPTDGAFTKLAQNLGFDGDTSDEDAVFDSIVAALTDLAADDDPIPLLTDILLYHVAPGARTEPTIDGSTGIATLLEGAEIMPMNGALGDLEPDLLDPLIVTPDIEADNGIIQAIDNVLLPLDIAGNTPPNIVEIASASDDFNLLVRALSAADLVTTIQDAEDITVFAPTDVAFTQLAVNLGFDGDTTDEDAVFDAIVAALTDLGEGDPIPLLTQILQYHVSPGAKLEGVINGSDSVATLLDGATISPTNGDLVDREPDLADPKIVTEDINASNGIIQAIDNVLLPIDIPGNTATPEPDDTPTITGLVAASAQGFDVEGSEFDMLLAAVQAAGLTDALDAADADLTVFAPNDAAFVGLAQALGFQDSDEAGAFDFIVDALTLLSKGGDPIPLLTQILQYHVSPGEKDSTAVTAATTLDTLLTGATVGVSGTSLVDNDPDIADPNLVSLDVAASNGVVHVLDGVLLPVDILPSDGSDQVDFVFGSDADGTFQMGVDNDFVNAGGGNDTILGEEGDDVIVGGDGTDTAQFANSLSAYSILIDQDGTTIVDKSMIAGASTGVDFLNSVELLEFGDGGSFAAEGAVDLSILEGAKTISSDNLETLTELYVAYFDRAPDAFGLLFWANALEQGVTLREISNLFFDQDEARSKLPDSLSTTDFVNTAYNHVLERDADTEGRDFWVSALDDGGVSRAEFMLELIAGARANSSAADDVRTIEDKGDIGVSYAAFNGLTDVTQAEAVMDAYDRSDADGSLATAKGLIDDLALDASGAADGSDTIVKIVGLVDDPLASDAVA